MRTKSPRPVFLTEIASQATLLSDVLEHLGVPRDAETGVPPEWLGRAMAAYKGGRCEAMLPGMIVPVRYADVISAHPVVGSLIGASEHLVAERIAVLPCTDEARGMARTVTLERLRAPTGGAGPVQSSAASGPEGTSFRCRRGTSSAAT